MEEKELTKKLLVIKKLVDDCLGSINLGNVPIKSLKAKKVVKKGATKFIEDLIAEGFLNLIVHQWMLKKNLKKERLR